MRILFSFMLLLGSFLCSQESLRVGSQATTFELEDADGISYNLGSWTENILQINYVDPDESELNEHFNDAVKHAIDVDSLIVRKNFKGIGIADCRSSWKPNFAIRLIGGAKAKKFDTTVLFDYEATLRDSWGLKKNSYNIIILDKNRTVRALIKDRIPEDQVSELVQLIVDLQDE